MSLEDGSCVEMIGHCIDPGCTHRDRTCPEVRNRVKVARLFDAESPDQAKARSMERRAVGICMGCPVWEECLRDGAAFAPAWWYGPVRGRLTTEERRRFQASLSDTIDVERAVRYAESKSAQTSIEDVEAPLAGTEAGALQHGGHRGEAITGPAAVTGSSPVGSPAASTKLRVVGDEVWGVDVPSGRPMRLPLKVIG